MIKYNIKNILKSPMYTLGVAFIVLLLIILQFPELLYYSSLRKISDLTFLSHFYGYFSHDSGFTITVVLSLVIPVLIIFVGTYDDVHNKKYVNEYVISRVGKSNYFKSRTIAIGIVTTCTFIAINLLLFMLLALRYGISFGNSYDVSVVSDFTTMTGVTIIISSFIQAVIYGIVASGMFILSQLISTKRFIDTIVLIQLSVIALHLVLLLSGVIFNYAGYTLSEQWISTNSYSQTRFIIPVLRNAFIANPTVFANIDGFSNSTYVTTTLPDNMYLSHMLSSLFLVIFVLLIYVGIPLSIYKVKKYMLNKEHIVKEIDYTKTSILTKFFNKNKVISYSLYFIPVLIFMLFLRSSSINEVVSWNREYSSLDIAEALTFYADYGLNVFLLPILFLVMTYQILREIDFHLDGQVHIRMIRYDSKTRYFINIAKIAILKMLPYLVIFTSLFFILIPSEFDYSNIHLVLIPLLLSMLFLSIIASLARVIFPIYPALIAVGLLLIAVFVFNVLLVSFYDILPATLATILAYIMPIYNFQAIYISQEIDEHVNWLNDIDADASFHSPVMLCIVILLQIVLFTLIFIKVGKKKFKELR